MMNKYLNIFNLNPGQCEKLLATAKERGAGFADLYFEHSIFSSLILKDSVVCSCGLNEDYGLGVRTVSGERTGYSYCENTEEEDMLKAAKAAASIAEGGVSMKALAAAAKRPASFYSMEQDWKNYPISSLAEFMKDLERRIRLADSRVKKVIIKADNSISDILICNSFDESAADSRILGTIRVNIIMDGYSNSVSRSYRSGAEMLNDELAEELVTNAVKGIDEKLQAICPKGGEMPVVIGAGAGGILLHEAMGHAFEADFNRKGQSIFSDRMNEQICRKGINIVDDGTIFGNRGACNCDDEGTPGQKTYMVTDGRLTSYLHDRISAGYYGVEPSGNGRRESFRYNPIPRMRATYMENGEYERDEIIASVKKGIYVDEFSNGQVRIGEGDYTFYVKSGFLIEDGKLTAPVKDINISGNGPATLADISMVGNDLKIDNGAWTCGKEQSVSVSCGIPTVKVDKLTVGGE